MKIRRMSTGQNVKRYYLLNSQTILGKDHDENVIGLIICSFSRIDVSLPKSRVHHITREIKKIKSLYLSVNVFSAKH